MRYDLESKCHVLSRPRVDFLVEEGDGFPAEILDELNFRPGARLPSEADVLRAEMPGDVKRTEP